MLQSDITIPIPKVVVLAYFAKSVAASQSALLYGLTLSGCRCYIYILADFIKKLFAVYM